MFQFGQIALVKNCQIEPNIVKFDQKLPILACITLPNFRLGQDKPFFVKNYLTKKINDIGGLQ